MNKVTKYSTILMWLIKIINYTTSVACEIPQNTEISLQFPVYSQSHGRNFWTTEAAVTFHIKAQITNIKYQKTDQT
jgi:hypothetical protein